MMATISWLERHMESLPNGGYWHVPSCDAIFKIDKDKRELTLISGDIDSMSVSRLSESLPEIGYKLVTPSSTNGDYCP